MNDRSDGTSERGPGLRTAAGDKDLPGYGALLASAAGTAMATVCALGLFSIERLVGGVWSVAAIVLAGLACAVLARSFADMTHVLPSGAGPLAFIARTLGKSASLIVVMPYLLLMLLLVGVESMIVGELLAMLCPIPVELGAVVFIVGTWGTCRAGIRIGYMAQSVSTWALVLLIVGLAIVLIVETAASGQLGARLWTPAPDPSAFVAAVGQALFLFMGFELVSCQVTVARDKRDVSRALQGSVLVLAVFYAAFSVTLSVMPGGALPTSVDTVFVPQILIAEQSSGIETVLLVTVACLAASFSSFNGGLLALSRFAQALSVQGALPRTLGTMNPRTLLPTHALDLLLVLSLVFTALVYAFDLYRAVLLASAVAVAIMYAVIAISRRRPPFATTPSPWGDRIGLGLGLVFVLLAVGVLVDAGPWLLSTASILVFVYGAATWSARRLHQRTRQRHGERRHEPNPST